MRVGAYGRISDDQQDTGAGVDRQIADAHSIAGVRGWEIVKEYVDNDLSAFKRRVVRPQFEQMLVDLQSGVVDGIIVYDLDRFARQPHDLERAIQIYDERKPAPVFASVQGDINLQTPDGKTMARVMVAFANKASMDTARRVARKHLENAKQGKPVGGFRPFGWLADKSTLHPTESPLVLDAIDSLLAGVSMKSILRVWHANGIKTTAGKEWTVATMRQYLKNPRLKGVRTHQRVILLNEKGKPVKGQWTPMVDHDTFDRLQLLLTRPDTRSRTPQRNKRHYLLTGLIRCGICNNLMYGNRYQEGRHYYICQGDGQHRMSVSGHGTDALIEALVMRRLASEDLVTVNTASRFEGEAELTEAQGQVDALMTAFLSKTLSGEVVFPRVQALEETINQLKAERAVWLASTVGPDTRAITTSEWARMDVDVQRAHLEQLLEAVLIRPAVKQQNRLDPDRVEPVWREERSGLHAV